MDTILELGHVLFDFSEGIYDLKCEIPETLQKRT